MDKDIMPFILFLLYSDELQKQSDRVIGQITTQPALKPQILEFKDGKISIDKLLSNIESGYTHVLKNTEKLIGQEQDALIKEIKNSNNAKKLSDDLLEGMETLQRKSMADPNSVLYKQLKGLEEIEIFNASIPKLEAEISTLNEKLNLLLKLAGEPDADAASSSKTSKK